MIDSNNYALKFLKLHEGFERYPYKDNLGILTIGYGRNLESMGILEQEASFLLQNDINHADRILRNKYSYYKNLSDIRQAVLIDMIVNLGSPRFSKFNRMHAALRIGDYKIAAVEMLDSRWANQVGNRAVTLSKIMETNKEE